MVEKIQPRNTWSRVTSPSPVKKIDRRRDQQERRKFQKHLAEKDASAGDNEDNEPESKAAGSTGAKEPDKTDPGAATKPGKRIDIIV